MSATMPPAIKLKKQKQQQIVKVKVTGKLRRQAIRNQTKWTMESRIGKGIKKQRSKRKR